MSYSNQNVELVYIGNGGDTNFSVNFHYKEGETENIQVELWDYTDPNLPVQLPFVLNTDYTIDESAYPNTIVNTMVAVPVDHKLIIYRSTEAIQTSEFVNGSFPAESVEEGLDKATMIAQEVQAQMGRAILNPIGGPSVTSQDLLEALQDVQDQDVRITANENQLTINTPAIAANTANISTNSTGIGNNASAIATNTSDISTLQSQIGSLAPAVIVNITSAITHNADNGEVIIIDTNDVVAVALPAPVSGNIVRVKISEKIINKTITSGVGIDGFGTTYTLTSEYESISLMANGTKWFII